MGEARDRERPGEESTGQRERMASTSVSSCSAPETVSGGGVQEYEGSPECVSGQGQETVDDTMIRAGQANDGEPTLIEF